MTASAERRVSGVFDRRRYHRGGRRLEDRRYDAYPQVHVKDVADELSSESASESQATLEWTDFLTVEVEAVLDALKRVRP
jgi:hypothetical protein